MDRAQKKELVQSLNSTFNEAGIVVVAHYKGLSVSDMESLRGKIRDANASIKVSKNRLTKLALAGTAYEQLTDKFTGPTAVAVANDDPVGVTKALTEFAKDNENLVILGGALGERALEVSDIEALAKMPSLDELRAKIISMLQTPATRIAGVLQAPGGQVARVVGAYAAKEA